MPEDGRKIKSSRQHQRMGKSTCPVWRYLSYCFC